VIRVTRIAAGAVLVAAVSGCAADGPALSGTAAASGQLRVGLVEWRIIASSTALTAGVDHLTITNTGTTGHDLYISGPGVRAHTDLLPPGMSATLTVTTRPGSTLALTCEVPGHEQAGMRSTITVTG